MPKGLIFKDEVYAIVGAAMQVHSTLGAGFLEAVYQEALEIELANRSIPFKSQYEIAISYNGQQLHTHYIADFLIYNQIIVEIKAIQSLTAREESQTINYLKATGLPLGLLINFGSLNKLEWKRLANTKPSSRINSLPNLREN